MISFLLYMMVGALLLVMTFDTNKLKEVLPTWYINYTIKMVSENKHVVERKVFDKVIFSLIFLMYAFGWPAMLWITISKLIKGEK